MKLPDILIPCSKSSPSPRGIAPCGKDLYLHSSLEGEPRALALPQDRRVFWKGLDKLRTTVGFTLPLHARAGFTLLEIVIVIALLAMISTIGFVAGITVYQRYLFRADLEKTATLLQKARSSAMNNIGETDHGVYVGDANNLVLFRGSLYDPHSVYNLYVEKNKTILYKDTCGSAVVFRQLSGATLGSECQIILSGIHHASITINNEGGINW